MSENHVECGMVQRNQPRESEMVHSISACPPQLFITFNILPMAFHAKPFRGVFGGILLFVCLLAAALLSAASPTKRAPLAPLKAQKLASSTVLVLDLGSTSVKAGYVGSAKVAFSVPSVYVDIGNGTVLVGDEAKNSGRKTRSPIVNGVLKDL